MRRVAAPLVIVFLAPVALAAQGPAPAPARATVVDTSTAPGWCFGVKLAPRDRCANFAIIEIGARFRTSGRTDHSTRDPAHAYPTLDDHGYLAVGVAHGIAPRTALGVVGEYGGGGGERQSVGVRFDRQLGAVPRLDFTAGLLRVETHQRGVTKRRWATGRFVDGAIRASDLLVIQARVEHVPGDGARVKPATAAFIGTRVEGGGAVKTTIVAVALLAILEAYVFFGGGGGD